MRRLYIGPDRFSALTRENSPILPNKTSLSLFQACGGQSHSPLQLLRGTSTPCQSRRRRARFTATRRALPPVAAVPTPVHVPARAASTERVTSRDCSATSSVSRRSRRSATPRTYGRFCRGYFELVREIVGAAGASSKSSSAPVRWPSGCGRSSLCSSPTATSERMRPTPDRLSVSNRCRSPGCWRAVMS